MQQRRIYDCCYQGRSVHQTCGKAQTLCTNHAQHGGLCRRHGAKAKLCSSGGCTNQVVNGGVCKRHGATHQTLCSSEGCTNKVYKGWLRKRHGARAKIWSSEGCTNTNQAQTGRFILRPILEIQLHLRADVFQLGSLKNVYWPCLSTAYWILVECSWVCFQPEHKQSSCPPTHYVVGTGYYILEHALWKANLDGSKRDALERERVRTSYYEGVNGRGQVKRHVSRMFCLFLSN